MILYHGTCDSFVPDNKREGLIPKKHAFQLENSGLAALFLKSPNDHNAVYLTASLATARVFADYRARYERATYGADVAFFDWDKRKLTHEIRPTAKPAIITINVPDSWKPYIKRDTQCPPDNKAYWTYKPIPPEYIQGVKC